MVDQLFCLSPDNLITFSNLTIFFFLYSIAYMRIHCPIFEPNPVFFNYFLVAEFETIIATLYNHQASYSSAKLRLIHSFLLFIPRSFFWLSVLLLTLLIAISLKDFLFFFSSQDINNKKK